MDEIKATVLVVDDNRDIVEGLQYCWKGKDIT